MAGFDQLALFSRAPLPEQDLQNAATALLIHNELSKLSTIQGRVVRLAFFEGLSHFEISTRVQLPFGTVKSQMNRALMKLRRVLQKLGLAHAFVEPDR